MSNHEFITGIISHEIKLANQTITEIKALVEYLCNHLGNKKTAKECRIIANDINEIINLIMKGLDPKQICCILGFCEPHVS